MYRGIGWAVNHLDPRHTPTNRRYYQYFENITNVWWPILMQFSLSSFVSGKLCMWGECSPTNLNFIIWFSERLSNVPLAHVVYNSVECVQFTKKILRYSTKYQGITKLLLNPDHHWTIMAWSIRLVQLLVVLLKKVSIVSYKIHTLDPFSIPLTSNTNTSVVRRTLEHWN